MDSAGSTVPAWKRLGLKLRNQSQSGATLPALDESQTPKTQRETPSYALGPTIPTENGKPPKLGKRKHQVEPAEDQGQTIKRSKRDANGAKLHGITGDIAVAPAKEENGQANSVPETSASDGQRPKGDPNYRKKKKNGKRIDDTKQSPDESHFGNFSFGQSLREDADSPDQTDGPTLLVSTEIDFEASEPVATPLKQKPKGPLGKTAILATSSLSPPQTDRRKSVTFTPDTKTTDGNSAQNLFKKWVQEQKGVEAEFTQIEVAQFAPPPKSHPANSLASLSAVSKDTEETQEPKPEKKKPTKEATANPDNSPSSAPKGKKKDPSLYIAYLKQYHTDREHWKFNKAKQNDLIDNALNIFRIPGEHDEALFEYIKGLKGAGVIERLKEKCKNTLQALDMDDPNDRNAAREEALKERVTKEKKRRRLDGDLENLIDHPSSEGYIRRLKRARAERLLNALNMAAPAQPTSTFQTRLTQKVPRKRNLRTAASSDESSSDSSSSEESSSSESESESEDSEESKDESSSQSESESDSDSSSEASDSAGSSSSSSSSDSDSD